MRSRSAISRPARTIQRHHLASVAQRLIEFLGPRRAGGGSARRHADAASRRSAATRRADPHREQPRTSPVRRRAVEDQRPHSLHRLAGRGAHNDVPAIARRFADKISFAICGTGRKADGSLIESDHLDGDVDMVAVLEALLAEKRRRAAAADPVPARSRPPLIDDLRKPSAPIPAIPRSAGCAASPNCAAPSAPSNMPIAPERRFRMILGPRIQRRATRARARLTHPGPSSSLLADPPRADTGAREKQENDRQTEDVADA